MQAQAKDVKPVLPTGFPTAVKAPKAQTTKTGTKNSKKQDAKKKDEESRNAEDKNDKNKPQLTHELSMVWVSVYYYKNNSIHSMYGPKGNS